MFEPNLTVDWNVIENDLYIAVVNSITILKNSNEEFSCLAFDSDPTYGYSLICFNTKSSSDKFLKTSDENNYNYINSSLTENDDIPEWLKKANLGIKINDQPDLPIWRKSFYLDRLNSFQPYCNNVGDFSHIEVEKCENNSLANYFTNIKDNENEHSNYLHDYFKIIAWNTTNKIVKSNILNQLNISRPFIIGLQFHDDEFIVLRAINLTNASS